MRGGEKKDWLSACNFYIVNFGESLWRKTNARLGREFFNTAFINPDIHFR